jgi:hypothetical protein
VKVIFWGTRGSLATPGRETARYGGNTSCVEVIGQDGTRLVLDAGTGIRGLGLALPSDLKRVDVLLSHLHLTISRGSDFSVLCLTRAWRCISGGQPVPRWTYVHA